MNGRRFIALGCATLIVALSACSGSGSSDGPATAETLAKKLKDAAVCKKVAPAGRAATFPGGWKCHIDSSTDDAEIATFASAKQARIARDLAVGKVCKTVADESRRLAAAMGVGPPASNDQDVPLVFTVGGNWLVVVGNDGGPVPWKAARALHGHVVDGVQCGSVPANPS